jgi:hypothetical protein
MHPSVESCFLAKWRLKAGPRAAVRSERGQVPNEQTELSVCRLGLRSFSSDTRRFALTFLALAGLGLQAQIIIVPNSKYLITGSKDGDLFVLDKTPPLSGSSLIQRFTVDSNRGAAFYNSLAFWNNTVYTWCSYGVLKAYSFHGILAGTFNPSKGTTSLGYQGGNLGTLYTSHLNGLYFQKFTPPVVANGKVYVATASNQVLVYGLGGKNP